MLVIVFLKLMERSKWLSADAVQQFKKKNEYFN